MIETFSSAGALLAGIHDERDMLEEARHVLEVLHRAHEFLEVLEPAGGLGRAVLLPHLGVARFLEDQLGELLVGERLGLMPAQRPNAAMRSRRVWRGFGFSSSVSDSTRAACISGTPFLRP